MSFPNNFLWGASIAAHQCEGSFAGDGKGRGISEREDYKKPLSDFYHHYKKDIELFSELGLKAFRLSIDWSRIYPDPWGEANQIGINYYRDLLGTLKEKGIIPIVTLSHYEMPYEISKIHGFYSKESVDLFMKYVRTCFDNFGDLVTYWLTFNELNCEHMPGHNKMNGIISSENHLEWDYVSLNNKLVASAKATILLHEMFPKSKMGNMIGYFPIYPETSNPKDFMKMMFKTNLLHHICLEVQCNGEYPYFAHNYFKQNNIDIQLTEEEKAILKSGVVDFISMSYYCSNVVTYKYDAPRASGNQIGGIDNPFLKKNDWGWTIDPEGLRIVLNDCYQRYKKPIIIVENGLGAYDKVENNKVHDDYRIEYFHNHLSELKKAVDDGVDIFGYCLWSAIDIVSVSAYTIQKRYGLIYVDVDDDGNGTFKRIKKDSFDYYKKVIETNGEAI